MKSSVIWIGIFAGILCGCESAPKNEATKSNAPAWIVESNLIATEYSKARAELFPESGSGLGYREYDTRITRVDRDLETRYKAYLSEWKGKLTARLATTQDPEVKIDIRVLLEDIEQAIKRQDLQERYGEIDFFQVGEQVFYSLRDLINEQSPSERKAAAVERFHKYVRGFTEDGKSAAPLTEAAKLLTEEKLKLYSKKSGSSKGRTFQPLRAEVEHYLKNSEKVVDGIKDVLSESGRDDWKEDFAAFKAQMKTYDHWLRTVMLPLARRDHKLPRDIYAWRLHNMGNSSTPEATRDVARKAFTVGLKEYRDVAAQIAKRDGLKDASPQAVIAHLKKSVETDPEKVRARYEKANAELSTDIQRRDLVTLPKAPLRIRVASEAESRLQPVPHLTTPPFVGNVGERPEFIVPVGSKEKLAFDDFAFSAAAKSLTAHEARPGHDLQFSSVLDRGVSIIRANYAFNSVNVEGWGLYAEWLMEPSLSLDEKMALLMMRLMRNARMFLDPELHLGLITPAKAKKVITDDVAMTPEWADLELQRYMYKDPAQAPSYFYGYLKLREIRDETIKRLGANFRERCFHDAIMGEGLLPLGILAEKMRGLKCQ